MVTPDKMPAARGLHPDVIALAGEILLVDTFASPLDFQSLVHPFAGMACRYCAWK